MRFDCDTLDREPIAVERIRVEGDRIVFAVRVRAPHAHRTSPALAARALERRPDLARHACVNARGSTFGAVMDDTPLPHLLEHVAIDFLVEESDEAAATYVGTSRWTDERRGAARVELSMDDDLATLRAFKRALSFVNDLVRDVAPAS